MTFVLGISSDLAPEVEQNLNGAHRADRKKPNYGGATSSSPWTSSGWGRGLELLTCGPPGTDRPVSCVTNPFCQSDARHLRGDRNGYMNFRGCKPTEEHRSHGCSSLPSGLPIFHPMD